MDQQIIVNSVVVNNKGGDKLFTCLDSVALQKYFPHSIFLVNYGGRQDEEALLQREDVKVTKQTSQSNTHGFTEYYQGTYKNKPFVMFSTDKILSEDTCRELAVSATIHQTHIYTFLSSHEYYVNEEVVLKCAGKLVENFNIVGVVYPDGVESDIHKVGQFHSAYFMSNLFFNNFKTLPNINSINEFYHRGHVLNVPEPLVVSSPREIILNQDMFKKVKAKFQ